MANIWEKAISILAGDLNLGHSYVITTVLFWSRARCVKTALKHGQSVKFQSIKKWKNPPKSPPKIAQKIVLKRSKQQVESYRVYIKMTNKYIPLSATPISIPRSFISPQMGQCT